MPPSGEAKPATDAPLTPVDRSLRLLTSWVGQLTGLLVAVMLFIAEFQKLDKALVGLKEWRFVIYVAVALLLLLPLSLTIRDALRKKTRIDIASLKPGYFTLAPREQEENLYRTDGEHEKTLRWLEENAGVLYVTGLSGSGKSSLLASWVLPKLAAKNTLIVRLRGYQDAIPAIQNELLKPGIVWRKPPDNTSSIGDLLERACKHIRPKHLLIVLDQFEEFLILREAEQRQAFQQFLAEQVAHPLDGLTFLLVLRSDYIGLIDGLGLPPLLQNRNWKEVPPFTETAALQFVRLSGLKVSEDLLTDVLREAAEIDQKKGLIRPITINLSGMVLSRFATGLHGGFRPGTLIRGFLRESLSLPGARDVATLVIPMMITESLTKRPRTISELAAGTGLSLAAVRDCLWALGQTDRGIVRPLGENQQTWEIAHDFLVPLLDAILARWTVSFWRRSRPWVPWLAAVAICISVCMVRRLVASEN